MAKILDQYGQPIEMVKLKDQQTSRVSSLHSQFASHPSRGLTPAKLARIMQLAEQGDMLAQHDLFLDMEEKDAHVYAEMSKRKRILLTLDWDVVPPRNASAAEKSQAIYAKELVSELPDFEDMILDMLDAIGHGFSMLEIEWQKLGMDWLPKKITHRPHNWFQLDTATRSILNLRDGSLNGQALQPFGWIQHVHRAKSGYIARAGLHRVLAWPYLFKNYAVRDLAEFLEIHGLPLRLGTYQPGATDEEKNTLMRAVVNIGHDAAGIIPEGMAIEFKEAARGGHDPYQAMIDWAERSISKAILGGTLTSGADGKSSTNALGNVHNEVRHDLKASDAMQLAGTLTRDLIYPLIALNKGGIDDTRRTPKFVFDLRDTQDIKTFADSLPALVGVGLKIPVSWVNEQLRIPEAVGDEAVLTVPEKVSQPPLGQQEQGALKQKITYTKLTQKEPDSPTQAEEDLLDEAVVNDWEDIVRQIRTEVERAESLESLQTSLVNLYGGLESERLTNIMAAGFALVQLKGMAAVQDEVN